LQTHMTLSCGKDKGEIYLLKSSI